VTALELARYVKLHFQLIMYVH